MAAYWQAACPDGSIGAEIAVDDLAAAITDPAALDEIQRLLDRRGVVHITAREALTPESFGEIAFSLGLSRAPAAVTPNSMPGHAHITVFEAKAQPDDGRPPVQTLSHLLHYDNYGPRLMAYSVLHTRQAPVGLAQEWVDMAAVLADLPGELREIVAGRDALHGRLAGPNQPLAAAPEFDRARAARLPLVVRHGRTGRPVLHLPRHPMSLIDGLGDDEGRAILAELWHRAEHSPHRFRRVMRPNDLVLWDNLSATHTNPPYRRDADRLVWFLTIPNRAPLAGFSG